MELRYLNNDQLKTNIGIYSFDDCHIELDDGKIIYLNGVIDVSFSKIGDWVTHPYGVDVVDRYEVDEVHVNITTIYDSNSIKITLNDEERKECELEIEGNIREQAIETI